MLLASSDACIDGMLCGQVAVRTQMSTKKQGSISVRVTSNDKPELAYSMLIPLLGALWGKIRGQGEDEAF